LFFVDDLFRLRAKVCPFWWAQQLLKPKPAAVNDRVGGLSETKASRLFEIGQRAAALPVLKPRERTGLNRRFAYVQKSPVIGHPIL
jgi:hypothetical protein